MRKEQADMKNNRRNKTKNKNEKEMRRMQKHSKMRKRL